jgi:integrase
MPRALGVRQLRSRRCGCEKCRKTFPTPERRPTKECSGSWQARYSDETGKRIPITRKKKDDAVKARTAAMAAVEANTHTDPKRGQIKLRVWRETWRAGRNVERHTMQTDDSLWSAQVGPQWGESPLRSIRHQAVQNWAVELERKGLAPDTVRDCVRLLGMMLAAAKRDQRIGLDPTDGIVINPGRGRPSAPTRPPSVQEVDLVAAHIAPAGHRPNQVDIYSRIPLVMRETGLRPEEAFGLLPDCVDLDDGWLTVRRVLENVAGHKRLREYPKSEAGYRQLPLTHLAIRMFTEHFEIQPPVDGKAVFRTLRGAWIDSGNFYRRWLAGAVKAGVHVEVKLPSGIKDHWPTVYHLRHAYASRLENAGVPWSIIKMVCGHERPKGRDVTWTYVHAPEDPAVYGPIVLAALEGEPDRPVARALRLVS